MVLRDRLQAHATRRLGTDEWDPAILAPDSDRGRITKSVGANPAATQRDVWRTAAEIFATARPTARLAALPEPVITGATPRRRPTHEPGTPMNVVRAEPTALAEHLDVCAAEAGRLIDAVTGAVRTGDFSTAAAALDRAAAAERAAELARTTAGRRNRREMRAVRRAHLNAKACRDAYSAIGH